MDELKIVGARLDVEIFVNCPHCDYMIDLLNERDTSNEDLNKDSALLRQVCPSVGSHDDFECESVTCTQCESEFSVKSLEWEP